MVTPFTTCVWVNSEMQPIYEMNNTGRKYFAMERSSLFTRVAGLNRGSTAGAGVAAECYSDIFSRVDGGNSVAFRVNKVSHLITCMLQQADCA